MPPEPSRIPRKWFLAVAAFALLLGLLPALLLIPSRRAATGTAGIPVESAPTIRQMDEHGLPIPWGGTAPGHTVRIEVRNVRAGRYSGMDVFLASENDPVTTIKSGSLEAELGKLKPGPYRLSVKLHGDTPDLDTLLAPPRGNPAAADFIIPPPSLEITSVLQNQLDGSEIDLSLPRTEAGALLSTYTDYPGAVLDVEVKPAAVPFDGSSLRTGPAQDGIAKIKFLGSDGPYHWRGRLTAADGRQTEWKEPRFGPEEDFIVFHKSTRKEKNPPAGRNEGGDTDEASNNDGSGGGGGGGGGGGSHQGSGGKPVNPSAISHTFSSGLGGGSHEPLPSEHKPLPSVWGLAIFRMFTIVGSAVGILALALLALRLWKRQERPQS